MSHRCESYKPNIVVSLLLRTKNTYEEPNSSVILKFAERKHSLVPLGHGKRAKDGSLREFSDFHPSFRFVAYGVLALAGFGNLMNGTHLSWGKS